MPHFCREDLPALGERARRAVMRQLDADAGRAVDALRSRLAEDAATVTPAEVSDSILGHRRGTKRPWSAAVPTTVDGVRFASKMEARVFARLKAELRPGETLLRQVRLPLLAIAPNDREVPLALTVDFAILRVDSLAPGEWARLGPACWIRWIEAKGKRRSRDWARGKAAFEATWGRIEEVER